MIRASLVSLVVVVSTSTLASCRRPETGAAPAGSASAAAAPGAATSVASKSCPAGKWKYDYKDQFLETLSRNTSGARVVSEKGEYVCTINGNERGSYVCAASEGGVENVFEAPMGAMAMKVTVKMKGSSSADFEPAGPGKWKTTRVDMSGLQMESKATIAGREVPMPGASAFPGMDRPGTVLEYRCEGDVLKLKPVVAGVTTDFITMKRVP
jgi:hypothetical protein